MWELWERPIHVPHSFPSSQKHNIFGDELGIYVLAPKRFPKH